MHGQAVPPELVPGVAHADLEVVGARWQVHTDEVMDPVETEVTLGQEGVPVVECDRVPRLTSGAHEDAVRGKDRSVLRGEELYSRTEQEGRLRVCSTLLRGAEGVYADRFRC